MTSISDKIRIDLKEMVESSCSLYLNFDRRAIEVFTKRSYDELMKDCKGLGYVLAIVPSIMKNHKILYRYCDADSLLAFKGKCLPETNDEITGIFWYTFNGQTFDYLGISSELNIPQNKTLSSEKKKFLFKRKAFLEAYIYSSSAIPDRALAGLGKLGIYYQHGIGFDRSLDEQKYDQLAFECYKRAAELQDSEALVNLGDCYLNGIGVDRSLDEQKYNRLAFESFQKAAEKQDPVAMTCLGACYQKGIGVDRSSDEQKYDRLAFESYQKAAKMQLPQALRFLGNCYQNGIGVDRSSDKQKYDRLAFECYLKAAEKQDPEVLVSLGNCYQCGIGVDRSSDVQKYDRLAFECYLKAAEQQLPKAFVYLSTCYQCGIGVDRNDRLAAEFLHKARELRSEY